MILYFDVFNSSNEIISDSYKLNYIYNEVGAEVKSNYVVKGEDNVDIGCGNAFSNPDAEADTGGKQPEKVLDVLDTFGYQETTFDAPSYSKYLKGYMKKLLEHITAKNPKRVDAFKAGAKEMATWIMNNFNDFTFYTPKDYDSDNIIILSYIKGEDLSPTFVYFMDGLKGEKY